jgi:hypothetical protein
MVSEELVEQLPLMVARHRRRLALVPRAVIAVVAHTVIKNRMISLEVMQKEEDL